MSKEPKKKKAKAEKPQYAMAMRLVSQATPHGEFIRFGWVTWEIGTNQVTGFEPAPIVYGNAEEAAQIAAQMENASHQGIVELKHTFKITVH